MTDDTKRVPRAPTQDMIEAWHITDQKHGGVGFKEYVPTIWRAMYDAAPAQPAPDYSKVTTTDGLGNVRTMSAAAPTGNAAKIWSCKIGEHAFNHSGADMPMREAVAMAYRQVTGHQPAFIFSGWGAELTEPERAVVENRLPNDSTVGGSSISTGKESPKLSDNAALRDDLNELGRNAAWAKDQKTAFRAAAALAAADKDIATLTADRKDLFERNSVLWERAETDKARAERAEAERDALLSACKRAWALCYDDRGAMNILSEAIDTAMKERT